MNVIYEISIYQNNPIPTCWSERAFPLWSWAKLFSHGDIIILRIGRINFQVCWSCWSTGFSLFPVLKNQLWTRMQKSGNAGWKNGCTTNAACPFLPSSFPSLRVTTVNELNLSTCSRTCAWLLSSVCNIPWVTGSLTLLSAHAYWQGRCLPKMTIQSSISLAVSLLLGCCMLPQDSLLLTQTLLSLHQLHSSTSLRFRILHFFFCSTTERL